MSLVLDACVVVLVVLDACMYLVLVVLDECVCLVLVVLDKCVFSASSIRRMWV